MPTYTPQESHNIVKCACMCKCFVVIMVLWVCNVDAEETYVVRKVNWGMTPEQVREVETWEFTEDIESGGKRKVLYVGVLLRGCAYLS